MHAPAQRHSSYRVASAGSWRVASTDSFEWPRQALSRRPECWLGSRCRSAKAQRSERLPANEPLAPLESEGRASASGAAERHMGKSRERQAGRQPREVHMMRNMMCHAMDHMGHMMGRMIP